MSVSVAVKNGASGVGEGPHWDPIAQCLYYVDIGQKDIHRWDSRTGEDTTVHFDGEDDVAFVVPRQSGGLVFGLGRKIAHFNWGSSEHTVLAEVDEGKDTRLNDAKCDASGRLWCGTMSTKRDEQKRFTKSGTLYSFERDHSVRKQLGDVYVSNGLAWNSDSSIMYYTDTQPMKIYAFDYDLNSGTISNQRSVVDFENQGGAAPDGMCIDSEGKLWVACVMGSKVARFDPETGKEIQSIKFPSKLITSCCFGGSNMDELYVTSIARTGSLSMTEQEPLAGSLFKVTGLGVKGPPTPAVFQG